ncbi:2-phospho-L-lactate guanylyltransferase [Microlunatus ginsengisoli]|uniref:2-phospho-L-lactate guanylyltransferase n=1 Tax=Microlunatus ginsengisoli TaxID=363863 RepID=A0ABP7AWB7_9ACTN
MEWQAAGPVGAVVALKPLRSAKSRLRGIPQPKRQEIAWALAADTIAALAAALDVVSVVSNEPSLADRLSELAPRARVRSEGPSLGMNAALAAGAAELVDSGASLVLACVADLPCLRPDTVRRLVAAATGHPRSFVADRSGVGTTMLFARGVSLDPRFQGSSAAAHRGSGAVPLTASAVGEMADARHDVDTLPDLYAAERVGVGPRTAALFEPGTGRLREHDIAGSTCR